jgi:hypothetical protein
MRTILLAIALGGLTAGCVPAGGAYYGSSAVVVDAPVTYAYPRYYGYRYGYYGPRYGYYGRWHGRPYYRHARYYRY